MTSTEKDSGHAKGGERKKKKVEEIGGKVRVLLPGHFGPSGLRLTSDGIHDGILRVHANRRVVLGMDDGRLTPRALHLYGLVGGQSRVLQGDRVETGHVLGAEVRVGGLIRRWERREREGEQGNKRKGVNKKAVMVR